MCIIIYKRTIVGGEVPVKDKPDTVEHKAGPDLLTQDLFASLDSHHPHGVGLMYADGEKVHIHRTALAHTKRNGYFVPTDELDRLYELYKSLDEGGADTVLHFRFATHGKGSIEAMQANCHPFHLPESEEYGYCHNGVITGIRTPKDDSISDSRMFGEHVLSHLIHSKDWRNDPTLWGVLEHFLGSNKVVIMDKDARVDILNEGSGTWEHGVWYSNHSFRDTWSRRRQTANVSVHHRMGFHDMVDGDEMDDSEYSAYMRQRWGTGGTPMAQWVPTKHTNRHNVQIDVGPTTLGLKLPDARNICRLCMLHITEETGETFHGGEVLVRSDNKGQRCAHCTLLLATVLLAPEEALAMRADILGAKDTAKALVEGGEESEVDAAITLYQNFQRIAYHDISEMEEFRERLKAGLMDGAFSTAKVDKSVHSKVTVLRGLTANDAELAHGFIDCMTSEEFTDCISTDTGLALLCDAAAIVLGAGKAKLDANTKSRFAILLRRSTGRVKDMDEAVAKKAREEAEKKERAEQAARTAAEQKRAEQENPTMPSPSGLGARVRRVPSILGYIEQNPRAKAFKITQKSSDHYEKIKRGDLDEMDKKVCDRGWWVLYLPFGERQYVPADDMDGIRKFHKLWLTTGTDTVMDEQNRIYIVNHWQGTNIVSLRRDFPTRRPTQDSVATPVEETVEVEKSTEGATPQADGESQSTLPLLSI